MEKVKAIVEAMIFASDTPLAPEKIRAVFPEMEKKDIKEIIDQLISEYNQRDGGIFLQEIAGGFQFRTSPELAQWIKKLKSTKPQSLSPQAMETLAIIAYKQPIVKSEIESIRGVDVGAPLKSLLDKKLIRIVGRKDVPGKPIIYGTTRKFLEVFNLKDLLDLPNLRELKELNRDQESADQESIEQEIEELGITEREIVEQGVVNPEVIEGKSAEQVNEGLEITEQEIVNTEVIGGKRKEQEIEEIKIEDVPDL